MRPLFCEAAEIVFTPGLPALALFFVKEGAVESVLPAVGADSGSDGSFRGFTMLRSRLQGAQEAEMGDVELAARSGRSRRELASLFGRPAREGEEGEEPDVDAAVSIGVVDAATQEELRACLRQSSSRSISALRDAARTAARADGVQGMGAPGSEAGTVGSAVQWQHHATWVLADTLVPEGSATWRQASQAAAARPGEGRVFRPGMHFGEEALDVMAGEWEARWRGDGDGGLEGESEGKEGEREGEGEGELERGGVRCELARAMKYTELLSLPLEGVRDALLALPPNERRALLAALRKRERSVDGLF